jgi:drug/metabolite transporter (DMT)-like permease
MASVYLVLATLLWGVWGFAYKSAVARTSPWVVQWIYSSAHFLIFLLGWGYSRNTWPFRSVSPAVIGWSVAASASAIAASTLLLFSLKMRPTSLAVAATSAYPLVTMAIAVISGTESIRAPQLLGALLVAGGVLLLNGG